MTQQQTEPPAEQAVLGLLQTEFTALRSEIGRLIDHQKDLQNLSLVSLGATFALIAALTELDSKQNDIALVLLLVPLLTLQFALSASDLARKILDLASYVDELSDRANGLVAQMSPALADCRVWEWETWKKDLFTDRQARKLGSSQLRVYGV